MYVGALPYCNNVPPLDWTATPRRLGCVMWVRFYPGNEAHGQARPAACRHAATNGHGPVRSLGTLYRVRSLRASRRLSRYVVRSLRASRRTPRPWSDRTGACRATCSSAPDNIGTPPPPIVSHACATEYLRGVPTPTHGYARCHSTSRTVLARTSSHASPHRHRARYGASQTTTCSQSVHRTTHAAVVVCGFGGCDGERFDRERIRRGEGRRG